MSATSSPCRCRARRVREAGFSLLEVLVAFVVLALVASVLFRIFSGGLRNVDASERNMRAVLIAESALGGLGAATPLAAGTVRSGAADARYAVELTVVPYDEADAAAALTLPLQLFRVVATVRWDDGAGATRSISLATLRAAPREGATGDAPRG